MHWQLIEKKLLVPKTYFLEFCSITSVCACNRRCACIHSTTCAVERGSTVSTEFSFYFPTVVTLLSATGAILSSSYACYLVHLPSSLSFRFPCLYLFLCVGWCLTQAHQWAGISLHGSILDVVPLRAGACELCPAKRARYMCHGCRWVARIGVLVDFLVAGDWIK